MCWAELRENINIQITDKDIEVYKVVSEANKQSCKSCIKGFMYGANTIYKIPSIRIEKTYFWNSIMYIEEAYHSYTKIQHTLKKFHGCRGIIVGNYIAPMSLNNPYYVATFIIPKGSQYAINWEGEIVSNQIMYIGKCLKL